MRAEPGAILVAARKLARRAVDPNLRFEVATFAVTFAYMHGDIARAVRRGRSTLRCARPALSPRVRCLLHTEVGVALHMAGEREEAGRRYDEALAIAEAAHDRDGAGRVLACIGFLRQDLGALEDAETAYQEALAIQEALGHRDVRGIVLGYLGNLERRRGRLSLAQSYYQRALEDLRLIGDCQFEAVVRMDRGLLLLDQGEWLAAEAQLTAALGALETVESPDIEAIATSALAVVAAKSSHLERARGLLDDARARMPPEGPRASVLQLHAAVIELEEGPAAKEAAQAALASAAATAESDDYTRLAAQLVERALARFGPPPHTIVLERSGAFFELPGAERVDLEKREPLKRMVAALVLARIEEPGRALSPGELCGAAWPDEKIIESAAKNRVRVAIATLRNLGLRDLLVTRGSAYLLSPDQRVLLI